MTRRCPKSLLRWAVWLALGGLLLAAQQQALLHPLMHLHGSAQRHADAQAEAAAHDEAAPDCALCLACAAAAHLAAAAAHGMAAPPWSGGPAVATAGQALAARALSLWHNRGPPGPA